MAPAAALLHFLHNFPVPGTYCLYTGVVNYGVSTGNFIVTGVLI